MGITDKKMLRAIVVLRVLARYAGRRESLPVMFSDEHTEENLFNEEWRALGIDITYPHGIRNRYQFFYAAHWLADHGYLTNLPTTGRWKRDDGYYLPTPEGYAAVAALGDNWQQWKPLPDREMETEYAR